MIVLGRPESWGHRSNGIQLAFGNLVAASLRRQRTTHGSETKVCSGFSQQYIFAGRCSVGQQLVPARDGSPSRCGALWCVPCCTKGHNPRKQSWEPDLQCKPVSTTCWLSRRVLSSNTNGLPTQLTRVTSCRPDMLRTSGTARERGAQRRSFGCGALFMSCMTCAAKLLRTHGRCKLVQQEAQVLS